MEFMDGVQIFVRWVHVVGGIIWLGFLFFFAFVFNPSIAHMEQETRSTVLGAFMGRLMRWVRRATEMTFLTGLILLGLVFHAGGLMFEAGYGWGPLAGIAALLPFLLFIPYDMTARSKAGGNMMFMGIGMLVISMAYLYFMTDLAGMTYRASMIHVGIFYGTVLAGNVFMHVLPVQKRLVLAMEEKRPPDPADMASLQMRARHNVFLAIPLVWAMLDQHSVIPGASSPAWFLGVLLVSIAFVSFLYRGAAARN